VSAAPATVIRSGAHIESERASHSIEQASGVASGPAGLRAFGRFVWDKRVWWIVPLAIAAGLNATLLAVSGGWSGGNPSGF
jgi:hypothetical protein